MTLELYNGSKVIYADKFFEPSIVKDKKMI